MDVELLKSVRIVQPGEGVNLDVAKAVGAFDSNDIQKKISGDGVRLDVYQKGRRKYAVLKSPNRYFPDKEDDYKFDKVDRSMSDDDVIHESLVILRGVGKGLSDLTIKQMITQDPWKDTPPTKRHYGFTYYHLNDGSQVHIEWLEGSSTKGSYDDNAGGFIEKSVIYFPYTKSNGTEGLPADLRDQSDVSTRDLFKYEKKDGTFDWGDKIEYSSRLRYSGTQKDSDIIKSVITNLQRQISKFNGTSVSDSKLALCDPDTESCKLIRHVDFNAVIPSTTTNDSASKDLKPVISQSSDKTKLFLVGLPDVIQIKVGENLPDFSVHVNKIYTPPEDNINNEEIDEDVEFDPEYQESLISIEEAQALILESQEAFNDADNAQANSDSAALENSIPISQGNWKLDLIPDEYVTNGGIKIKCCQIDEKVVNVKIAPPYLDMKAAAARDGVTLVIISGFRSPYDTISGKSEAGVPVSASSQKYLYDLYLAGKGNLAAPPGGSNHGYGIGLDLNTGGKSSGRFINVDREIYTWLVKNSWRYGFIRAVAKEEWHYDYLPNLAKKGPYGKLPASDLGALDTKFYKDWGLDNLSIT